MPGHPRWSTIAGLLRVLDAAKAWGGDMPKEPAPGVLEFGGRAGAFIRATASDWTGFTADDDAALAVACDRSRVGGAPRLVPDDDEADRRTTWGVRGGPSATLELALAGAVPAIEGVYALALIDNNALEAFEFASADSSLTALIEMANGLDSAAPGSVVGAVSRLSGYVAERRVASHLIERGAVVEFPTSASEPGFDLLVDGAPVQVKCLAEPGGVLEHIDKYPEIPVITNSELAPDVGHLPAVLVDERLSHAEVLGATEDTLRGIDLLDHLDDLIPFVSLAVAGARHGSAWKRGEVTTGRAVTRTVVDASVVGGLGKLGAVAGGALGAFVGPGGVVLGSTIGGAGGAAVGRLALNHVDTHEVRGARREAREALADFGGWMARDVLPARADALRRRREAAHRAGRRTSAESSLASVAAGMLVEHADQALARSARAQDYMNRVAFAGANEDRVLAGWVAVRYAPNVFHAELAARHGTVEAAVGRYADQLTKTG